MSLKLLIPSSFSLQPAGSGRERLCPAPAATKSVHIQSIPMDFSAFGYLSPYSRAKVNHLQLFLLLVTGFTQPRF